MIITSGSVAYSLIMVVVFIVLLLIPIGLKRLTQSKAQLLHKQTENMHGSWASDALAIYGCIYFMPYSAEFVCLASDCFGFSYDTLSTLYNFPSDAFSLV